MWHKILFLTLQWLTGFLCLPGSRFSLSNLCFELLSSLFFPKLSSLLFSPKSILYLLVSFAVLSFLSLPASVSQVSLPPPCFQTHSYFKVILFFLVQPSLFSRRFSLLSFLSFSSTAKSESLNPLWAVSCTFLYIYTNRETLCRLKHDGFAVCLSIIDSLLFY